MISLIWYIRISGFIAIRVVFNCNLFQWKYDYITATYQLLVNKKHTGHPIRLLQSKRILQERRVRVGKQLLQFIIISTPAPIACYPEPHSSTHTLSQYAMPYPDTDHPALTSPPQYQTPHNNTTIPPTSHYHPIQTPITPTLHTPPPTSSFYPTL